MKRIGSIILALCLLGSQVAHAAVGIEGVGSDSTIEIEIVDSLDQRVDLDVLVEDEAGTPLEGVSIRLLDPDNPNIPPITGSDQHFMTDATGHLLIKLFPQNRQFFQIEIEHTGYEPYTSERFQVTEHSEHIAVLKRATLPGDDYYTVYYNAREGGSVDRKSERVRWNQTPRRVPTPTPDEGWRFVGWTRDNEPVEPETIKIRKTTRFYAEFERLPPVVSPTPTPTVSPSPVPTPSISPDVTPPPSETVEPTDMIPVGPGPIQDGGTGGSNDGGSITPPSGGGDIPPTNQPILPEPGIPSPAPSGEPALPPVSSTQECHLHWPILALTVLTTLCALLRLRAIRRQTEEDETTKREEVPA